MLLTDLWKVDADRVMMPLCIADLRQFPAPLSWLEDIEIHAVAGLLTQQHDEATVVNKHGKMMSVHA